jgi:MarR family 2-MHQ and catechol resistance regulon transcriptional repressor
MDLVDHFVQAANEQRAMRTSLRVEVRTRHRRPPALLADIGDGTGLARIKVVSGFLRRLGDIARRVDANLESVRRMPVSLLHKGPQPVRELGRRIDLTSGAMTTAIDRLEALRLVTRVDHATDRRAWEIHLTSEGEALIRKMFAGHEDAMERAMRAVEKRTARR